MINKILDIIISFINYFINRRSVNIQDKKDKIEIRKAEIVFESEIESIAKKAESEDIKVKQKAIDDMRKLISEK